MWASDVWTCVCVHPLYAMYEYTYVCVYIFLRHIIGDKLNRLPDLTHKKGMKYGIFINKKVN